MKRSLFSLISVLLVASTVWSQEATEPDFPLHDAAESGDLEGLKKALNSGKPVDASNGEPRATPLMLACKAGHVEVVQYLLGKGGSLYYQDKEGNYPLHYAAMCADPGALNLLLEWQGNIALANLEGKTASDIASELGHAAVVSALANVGTYNDSASFDPKSQAESIIADPNTILTDLKNSPDMAAKLAPVQKAMRQEESAWMSRRLTNPSRLARAVLIQTTKEFDLVISFSNTMDANDVAMAMTEVSADWKERFDFVGKKLREQMRSGSNSTTTTTTASRGRASRRRSTTTGPSATPEPSPEDDAERALEQAMSSWLQSTSDNRENLCKEVKTDYLNDMMTVREVAQAGEVDKVILLIDALMLGRATSLDNNIERIAERKLQDSARNTGSENTDSTSTRSRRRR